MARIVLSRTCPHFSTRNVLSTVIIWDTLTTESLVSPDSLVANRTFPGAVASRRFPVMTTAMTG
jgi:hypothetical protein